MSNKVVFLKPANNTSFRLIPFGLLSLGSYLDKHGFEVKIIDCTVKLEYEHILKEIEDALFVGLSVNTYEVPSAYDISKYIKAHSKTPVLWGGMQATLYPEQTLADKNIDYIIINEGDETAVELATALKENKSVENIRGLGFKKDDKIVINPVRPLLNVEELPNLNYDLINFKEFVALTKFPAIIYESSRGCPYLCTFCWNVIVEGRQKFRTKSAKKIVDEIEFLMNKYKVYTIAFVDDNFFVHKHRVQEFCRLIKERNLKFTWYADCRADYFRDNYINEEFLDMLWESGLRHLVIGAESGSQRILDELKKGIKVEDTIRSAKTLSKYPIEIHYGFIIGAPSETKEELYETIGLMKKMRKINKYAGVGAGVLFPYPKSEITSHLVQEGILKEPKTLEEWTFEEHQNIHTSRHWDKPWLKHKKLIKGVSYATKTAFDDMRIISLKKILVNFQWYYIPDILFRYIAKLRVATNFYYLLFDKFLFDNYVKFRNDVYRKYILPLRSGLIKEKLNRRLNVSTLPQE